MQERIVKIRAKFLDDEADSILSYQCLDKGHSALQIREYIKETLDAAIRFGESIKKKERSAK